MRIAQQERLPTGITKRVSGAPGRENFAGKARRWSKCWNKKVWNLRPTLGDPCAHLKYQTVVSFSPNEASLMRFAYRVNRRAGLITQPLSMDEGDQNDDNALPYKKPRVMSIGHRQIMRLHCCP